MSKNTPRPKQDSCLNTVPLRLHLCASQDMALPAGSERPTLIWREAFDTIPCEGSETISSVPGSSGQLAHASSLFPHNCGSALQVAQTHSQREREGDACGYEEPPRPGNASLESLSQLERAGAQSPCPGVCGQKLAEMEQIKFLSPHGSWCGPISSFYRCLQKTVKNKWETPSA